MCILDKIKERLEKRKIKELSDFTKINPGVIKWKSAEKRYDVILTWENCCILSNDQKDEVIKRCELVENVVEIRNQLGILLTEVGKAVKLAVKKINQDKQSSELKDALSQFRDIVSNIITQNQVCKLVKKTADGFRYNNKEYSIPCYKQVLCGGRTTYFFRIKSIKNYFNEFIDDAQYLNCKIEELKEIGLSDRRLQGSPIVEELIKILDAELKYGDPAQARQDIKRTIEKLKSDGKITSVEDFFADITKDKAQEFIKISHLRLAQIKRICDKVKEFCGDEGMKYREKMEDVYFFFDNNEVEALEQLSKSNYNAQAMPIANFKETSGAGQCTALKSLFYKLRTIKDAVDLEDCDKKDTNKIVERITRYNDNQSATATNSINKIANTSVRKRIRKFKGGILISITAVIALTICLNIFNQEIRYYFKCGYQYSSQSAEFEFRKYDDSGAKIISAIPTRDDGLVEFPAQVELDESDKYKINVVAIGSEVFGENADTVKSIIVPANITYIGEKAFKGCSSLESITFEDGSKLTKIDSNAFEGCSKLEQINIPSSVTEIGENAFSGCSSLTSIIIPDSVTSIGSGAFSGCSSLESITIPFAGGTVKTESDTYQCPFGYIFGNTSYSGSVAVDQYYYGSGASDTMRTTYYIPLSLKNVKVTGGNILSYAFYNCSNLTNIAILDGVTSIGDDAFLNCESLTSITIPDSVTSIGDRAFMFCSSSTIYCEASSKPSGWDSDWNVSGCPVVWNCNNNDVANDGYIYYIHNGIRYALKEGKATVVSQSIALTGEVVLPESISYKGNTYGVTSIGSSAFRGCSSLTSITIPDSVTSIDIYAFYNCSSLTSITIPDSVTSVGNFAFDMCDSLTIYCEAARLPNSWDSYWNPSNCPVQWGYKGD